MGERIAGWIARAGRAVGEAVEIRLHPLEITPPLVLTREEADRALADVAAGLAPDAALAAAADILGGTARRLYRL